MLYLCCFKDLLIDAAEILNFRHIENSQKVMVGADGETNVAARRSGLIWLDVFLSAIFWAGFATLCILGFFFWKSCSLLRNPSNSTMISKICSKSCSRQYAWGKVTVFSQCCFQSASNHLSVSSNGMGRKKWKALERLLSTCKHHSTA